MQTVKLSDMVRGWFVGNFEPTAYSTDAVEVGVKTYHKGDKEDRHYHKIATEITVILTGKVRMNNVEYGAGEILVIPPLESTDFEALEDCTTVVVKLPGASNDKYLGSA